MSLNLTAEQQTIAQYWADGADATGTPPGHWIAIVGQIARNDGLSLTAAAEAAVSCLYGGIHCSFDNHDGLSAGQCIGQAINERVRFRNEDDE